MLALLSLDNPHAIVARDPQGQGISRSQMAADVAALAAALPAQGHTLNLCSDRYRFAVGFLASVARGLISLLPNAVTAGLIAQLQAQHADIICLTDGAANCFGLPSLDVRQPLQAGSAGLPLPQIAPEQLVAKVFTSGSTGQPQAHGKTWGKLLANASAEAAALRQHLPAGCHWLGTVPAQHMYGFESTVLLPLFGSGVLHACRPFFPADISATLATCPRPRALVTTPFHLRSLLDSAVPLPPLDAIVCATAPLSPELARRAEAVTGAPLVEIYGATETGQLAIRRSTTGPQWQCMPGVQLEARGEQVFAQGRHIEGEQALNDVVELQGEGRFLLLGRQADLVNIAGKRTSLAYLNQLTLAVPGVVDAAFFLPSEAPDGIGRLCAFIVAPGLGDAQIVQALCQQIDAAFLPRPIIFLAQLPRSENGKLPLSALQALYQEHCA